MPNNDHLWVLAFLIAVSGAGMFVRVLAKEKHRREKHLKLRLEAKMRQLADEERQKFATGERPARSRQSIGVTIAEDGVPVVAEVQPS